MTAARVSAPVECGECLSEAQPVNGRIGFTHAQRCLAWRRLSERHPRLAERVTGERRFAVMPGPVP